MSRASKSRDQAVIEFLEKYADETLRDTGFFHNGKNSTDMKVQTGVCRTNCIDCLDRTNAAQFVIGKKALGYQLYALNVISDVNIDYDSDAVNLLTEMFHDHGDTIALQYGGSHLVNTMETYRKINQWSSHSRDMIESIRRFYSNSFVDSQRQDAINLFLGNFVWEKGQPMLWDLTTDYYLHNRLVVKQHNRRSYLKWWTPMNLEPVPERVKRIIDAMTPVLYTKNSEINELLLQGSLLPYRGFFDNYWNEYYKPRLLSSFQSLFAYNMNSTLRYVPAGNWEESSKLGPFKSRKVTASHRLPKPSKPKEQSRHGKSHSKSGGKAFDPETIKNAGSKVETPTLADLPQREDGFPPKGPRKSESSNKLGALVQASTFYKNPSIHRFLTEPARLSERLLNIGSGAETLEENTLSNSMASLDNLNHSNSFTPLDIHGDGMGYGNIVTDDGMGLADARPLEETLESLLNPSVNEMTTKTYEMYANYEIEFTALSNETVAVDHPDYENYNQAVSPEQALQQDVPLYDSMLYDRSYELCTMGPPKTLKTDALTLIEAQKNGFQPVQQFDYTDTTSAKYIPTSSELSVGGSSRVVTTKDVKFYNDWLQSSGSM